MIDRAIGEIRAVIASWPGPVVVAYSGGKDSSAVVKLVFNALLRFPDLRRDLRIIYCDTGVENPIVSRFVKSTLRLLRAELKGLAVSRCVRILRPHISQRYFVRTVGRGYPPPTQFFRWCTKDLRIRPVQKFIKGLGDNALVLVGTRFGESAQRDRSMNASEARGKGPFIQRQSDGGQTTFLYSPIVNFDLAAVWETLAELPLPNSIDAARLAEIYRDGGGECPIVRETNDKPCSSARFGCWTCTVVRRDRSAERLIDAGYSELQPYHEFRHWLTQIRNDAKMRCKARRNGTRGLGPFTLRARKEILVRIRALETQSGAKILEPEEEQEIRRLWRQDQRSIAYRKLERAR